MNDKCKHGRIIRNGMSDCSDCMDERFPQPFVTISIGYGGAIKIRATINGEECVIAKGEAERIIQWVILDGKTLKTQTKRMIYPRLEFRPDKRK